LGVSLRLASSPDEIRRLILREAAARLAPAFDRAAPSIRGRVGALARTLIAATPEFKSLVDGDLRAHMGLADPESALAPVLDAVAAAVFVEVERPRASGVTIAGGISVGVLKSGFDDLIALSGSSYVSPPSGSRIRWLEWLLKAGDRIVIKNYGITFRLDPDERRRSRTGEALMFAGGKGWRVPPEHSGTEDDNFLTRAFEAPDVEDRLLRVFREEIEARLR